MPRPFLTDRSNRPPRRWATALLTLGTLALGPPVAVALTAPPAHAESDADRQKAARQLFTRGETEFKAGAFDAAANLFERAYATWPDPAYLYNTAFAFERAERWPLAVHWYDRFLATFPDSPNTPEVRRRRDAAATSRAAARASVLFTTRPAGARAELLVDPALGEPAPSCVTPCELAADPGPVAVRVTLGATRLERAKGLGPSERWALDLPLGAPPAAPDRTPSWVAWSIGGAALVAGVVLAAVASDTYDEASALAARSPLDDRDFRRFEALREDLRGQNLAADLSFGAALVGAAVGALAWQLAEPAEAP